LTRSGVIREVATKGSRRLPLGPKLAAIRETGPTGLAQRFAVCSPFRNAAMIRLTRASRLQTVRDGGRGRAGAISVAVALLMTSPIRPRLSVAVAPGASRAWLPPWPCAAPLNFALDVHTSDTRTLPLSLKANPVRECSARVRTRASAVAASS
jgi:hypothetical protein